MILRSQTYLYSNSELLYSVHISYVYNAYPLDRNRFVSRNTFAGHVAEQTMTEHAAAFHLGVTHHSSSPISMSKCIPLAVCDPSHTRIFSRSFSRSQCTMRNSASKQCHHQPITASEGVKAHQTSRPVPHHNQDEHAGLKSPSGRVQHHHRDENISHFIPALLTSHPCPPSPIVVTDVVSVGHSATCCSTGVVVRRE